MIDGKRKFLVKLSEGLQLHAVKLGYRLNKISDIKHTDATSENEDAWVST
jgi:sugar diacid utilization regulator